MMYRRFLVVIDCEEPECDKEGVLFVCFKRKGPSMGPNDFLMERVKGGMEKMEMELGFIRLEFNWQWQRAQRDSDDDDD